MPMLLLEKLAEAKIAAAADRGELSDLQGQGKPLVIDDVAGVPEDLRAGYRILKNSGYLPPELLLRKEIAQVEDLLKFAESDDEKKKLVAKLSLLKSRIG